MTTITLHNNVKVLASTYSAIALTLAMEEVLGNVPNKLDWDNVESVKALIDDRVAGLASLTKPRQDVFETDQAFSARRDYYELFTAATTEEMRSPLKLAPLHEMMDEYLNRVMTNPTVVEITARGIINHDDSIAQFETAKATITNS